MDWANRFSLGGFIVSCSTLHQMWEVIEKMEALEVSYRWFTLRKRAEAFCVRKISGAQQVPNTWPPNQSQDDQDFTVPTP